MIKTYQATVWSEGDLFVAQCLDVDVVSQGTSAEEAITNLREAVELFFETASEQEIRDRLKLGVRVTPIEVAVG